MINLIAIDSYPFVLPVREFYAATAGFLEAYRSLIVRIQVNGKKLKQISSGG